MNYSNGGKLSQDKNHECKSPLVASHQSSHFIRLSPISFSPISLHYFSLLPFASPLLLPIIPTITFSLPFLPAPSTLWPSPLLKSSSIPLTYPSSANLSPFVDQCPQSLSQNPQSAWSYQNTFWVN